MIRLSLVITTLNNEETLRLCLESVPFADEIVVLDSFSDDSTLDIARSFEAHIVQEAFRGYGPQKQRAVDLASHDWVLLLDADEALSADLAEEIQQLINSTPKHKGYRLLREEWLYWQWPGSYTGLTDHLRLFNRRHMHMSEHPVHAAPRVTGKTPLLKHRLRHYGEKNLQARVDRINRYSSQAVDWKLQKKPSFLRLRLLLSPPVAFLREYIYRRQFLNGWAGYVTSRTAAFHAFLRYAKLLEGRKGRSIFD